MKRPRPSLDAESFFNACRDGDLELVKEFVAQGYDYTADALLRHVLDNGSVVLERVTPIKMALSARSTKILKYLLSLPRTDPYGLEALTTHGESLLIILRHPNYVLNPCCPYEKIFLDNPEALRFLLNHGHCLLPERTFYLLFGRYHVGPEARRGVTLAIQLLLAHPSVDLSSVWNCAVKSNCLDAWDSFADLLNLIASSPRGLPPLITNDFLVHHFWYEELFSDLVKCADDLKNGRRDCIPPFPEHLMIPTRGGAAAGLHKALLSGYYRPRPETEDRKDALRFFRILRSVAAAPEIVLKICACCNYSALPWPRPKDEKDGYLWAMLC